VLNAAVGITLEGFAHQVSRSLGAALEQSGRPIKFVSAYETLSLINEAGLAVEYQDMVSGYTRTGILHRPVLERIGQAIEANYVLQPTLATFSQSMSGRFSFLGLRLIQTRISIFRLAVQLWDTRTGKIVRESSGEAMRAGEDVREFRIPFEEIAQRLWERMLKGLVEVSVTSCREGWELWCGRGADYCRCSRRSLSGRWNTRFDQVIR
jgi:hypothetical protein